MKNLSRIAAAAAMKPNGTAEAKEKAYAVWALQEAQMDMAALLQQCAVAFGLMNHSSISRTMLARLADFDKGIGA